MNHSVVGVRKYDAKEHACASLEIWLHPLENNGHPLCIAHPLEEAYGTKKVFAHDFTSR